MSVPKRANLEAVTENISANGLLFVSDSLPDIDSRIEFTISDAFCGHGIGDGRDHSLHWPCGAPLFAER